MRMTGRYYRLLRSSVMGGIAPTVIYAMAGGSIEHSRQASNIGAALKNALAGCDVYQSDAMTFVRATQLSTYADVAVVCGTVEVQKVERGGRVLGEALTNPAILVPEPARVRARGAGPSLVDDIYRRAGG